MQNISPRKSYTFYSIHIPIILLAVGLFFGTTHLTRKVIRSTETGSVLSKSTKGNSGKEKPQKPDTAAANKPDKGSNTNNGNSGDVTTTSGNKGKKKTPSADEGGTDIVVKDKPGKGVPKTKKATIEDVAQIQEDLGNTEVAEELADASEDYENLDELEDTVEEVTTKPKWKKFLFGSDYKNLGQLRSSVVQNRNTIRKLTKTAQKVEGEDSQLMLQQQIHQMEQEQEQMRAVIEENEDGFSMFGWVSRWMRGYEKGVSLDADSSDVDMEDVDESSEATESVE
jgi:hypothetical protein